MSTLWDVVGAALLLAGATLTLIAAVGMVRYKDLLERQHLATKPQVLGLVFNLGGAAMIVDDWTMRWTLVLVIAFQLITAPISAHMLSRTGFRRGFTSGDLVVDELREDLRVIRGEQSAGESGKIRGSR
ncbi:MAG: monovalent cation/H(+) antiporter subunit G [Actinomycetaceae bacterium]|nr:monovalent cation/H(+) antiporter subunit G [Actinomycetaceae bacterium]